VRAGGGREYLERIAQRKHPNAPDTTGLSHTVAEGLEPGASLPQKFGGRAEDGTPYRGRCFLHADAWLSDVL